MDRELIGRTPASRADPPRYTTKACTDGQNAPNPRARCRGAVAPAKWQASNPLRGPNKRDATFIVRATVTAHARHLGNGQTIQTVLRSRSIGRLLARAN